MSRWIGSSCIKFTSLSRCNDLRYIARDTYYSKDARVINLSRDTWCAIGKTFIPTFFFIRFQWCCVFQILLARVTWLNYNDCENVFAYFSVYFYVLIDRYENKLKKKYHDKIQNLSPVFLFINNFFEEKKKRRIFISSRIERLKTRTFGSIRWQRDRKREIFKTRIINWHACMIVIGFKLLFKLPGGIFNLEMDIEAPLIADRWLDWKNREGIETGREDH